jgi:hypothetical protein
MGPEIVAASIGSLALDAGSSIAKGQGEQASQEWLAQRDERAAQLGRIKADQTDAVRREELNSVLANIDVIRAASSIDPTSPTTAAIKQHETEISDRNRMIEVGSIRAQANEDELSAKYRRSVGQNALMMGYLGGATKALGAFGKMGSFGGGGNLGYIPGLGNFKAGL